MTKVGLIQFILLFLISAAYGQKVKYKDIYALLSTKQYEQAEPFLKNYLRENNENPNAFLFMGTILQEKSSKNDILKQTKPAIANMDSAISYYDRAYKLLDDREVRKNKEYYQAYNRRDLRTGEFGVKLSDIQFDIEKKIEGLKERIDKVKMVKYYFALADTSYQRSNALFISLRKTYPSEHQLYLRADENTVKNLSMLSMRFDSCVKAFENYKATSSSLGKTGYNQTVELLEISDFNKDGLTLSDLYQDESKLWDYKKFAEKSRQIIEKEIFPMREHLISYDMEINKLREKMNSDSVSVRSDLMKLIDKLLYDQLNRFDPDPLPMVLFNLKTTDLEYRSLLHEHKPLRDSTDIHLQIKMLNQEINMLAKLDSLSGKLPEEKLDEKALDYTYFINHTYNNIPVLKSYISTLKEYGGREQKKKSMLLAQWQKSLQYIVDGADSIPLSAGVASTFKPLFTSEEMFTMGLSFKDTVHIQGYFYTITPSRKPEVKALFPVNKISFKPKNLSAVKALGYADDAGQIYYVLLYSEKAAQEKFPATLAKIYRSDGLAWSFDCPLTFVPNALVLSSDTGELVIKDDLHQTVVDKNGKIVNKQ